MQEKTLSPNQRFLLNVVVPLLYLIPLVVVYILPKNFGFGEPRLVPVGLTVGGIGLVLWILGMVSLGNSLAVLPGSEKLVTRGIYNFIRHPIYLGIVLTLGGLFVACGSVPGMVYLLVVVVPLNIVRAWLEEKALLEKFGDAYRMYRGKTWL